MKKTSFKDFKGNRLNVGDLVCYVDPTTRANEGWNNSIEIYKICRSIYDEQLFLLPLHPFKDVSIPFALKYIDKVILRLHL